MCVSVALVIQHANRIRRKLLSSLVCPAVQHLSTLLHKRYDFRKKLVLDIKYVLIFSTNVV